MRSIELQAVMLNFFRNDHQINLDIATSALNFGNLLIGDEEHINNILILEFIINLLRKTNSNQFVEKRRIEFLQKIWNIICKPKFFN